MTIVQEVKKIIPSKLDDKAKSVYNRLKEETNNFDIEFLVVYTDLEKAVEQFVDVVKKKYPDAIRVVRKKEKPTPPPTPEPETDDKEVLEVIRDYRISETQAKRLVQLRRDASESKKESIDKMLDTLKKSEFYNARYTSKQNIDKNRTRDIKKDSNRGSLTAKDELNMTGKRYKRISKAGHKNQYGTTEGGKVYYEYRANRRDIDHKIELAKGGLIGKEVEFLRYGEPKTGKVIEDLGNDRFAVSSGMGQILVKKENITKVVEPKKGRFFGLFKKGGRIDLFETPEKIPAKIQEILDFYEEDFQDGNYNGLSKALKEVEANGYTFEFYLDGEAYGLRPKNVPLNHIKGYEEYSKGGGVGEKISVNGFIFDLSEFIKNNKNKTENARLSDLDIENIKKMPQGKSLVFFVGGRGMEVIKMSNGGGVEGRFKKHFAKGGWVLYDEDTQKEIKTYKTESEARKDLYEYEGNGNIVKKSVWDKSIEPKVDRFMFEEEIYEYGKGGWVLYDEDSQEPIRTYKTESEARKNLYEYEGNGNIVKKSVWDKTYEPKVDRFMFEEEMYEYKKGGRVSEDVYYDMLGAVPPIYISELDGVKQSGNTTFAVGEAYDYMNTPNGFKSVYQAYSQKGKFYYNEGLVYFTERGVAKSIKE